MIWYILGALILAVAITLFTARILDEIGGVDDD